MPAILRNMLSLQRILILGLSFSCSAASASPLRGPAATVACRQDEDAQLVFNVLKRRLIEFSGYSAADVVLVTDGTICAAGVAAHNAAVPSSHQIIDATVVRRGSDGFILVSPIDETEYWFSTTWVLESTSPSM